MSPKANDSLGATTLLKYGFFASLGFALGQVLVGTLLTAANLTLLALASSVQ